MRIPRPAGWKTGRWLRLRLWWHRKGLPCPLCWLEGRR